MASVSFEEASLALAEKRSATVAAVRAGKSPLGLATTRARSAPFFLADTGRPELAFFWKNLLSTGAYFNLRVLAIAAAVILVGSKWFLSGDSPDTRALRAIVLIVSVASGGYMLLLGPHLARQDLRSDLANADILKTYPIRGWQLLLGQLLAPTAILSGLVGLALLALVLALPSSGRVALTFTPAVKLSAALGIAAITPLICALQLLVLNGATLLFPAWFQTTRAPGGGGIELMGQRLIFVFGQLLVAVIALLPAAAAAFALIFASQWLIGLAAAIALASIAVFAVLAGEVWCALWWLGERFEHLDISAELRP
jgi:hypothetical protein